MHNIIYIINRDASSGGGCIHSYVVSHFVRFLKQAP